MSALSCALGASLAIVPVAHVVKVRLPTACASLRPTVTQAGNMQQMRANMPLYTAAKCVRYCWLAVVGVGMGAGGARAVQHFLARRPTGRCLLMQHLGGTRAAHGSIRSSSM
jgi:chemotaxis response regulator CheB